MKRLQKALVVAATLALLMSLSGILASGVAGRGPIVDVSPRQDQPDYNNGVEVPFDQADIKNAQPPLGPAKIGQAKTWLGLNDWCDSTGCGEEHGSIYLKNYTLRGVGTHVEVWVANDLKFPNPNMSNPFTVPPPDANATDKFDYDDCRNTFDNGSRITITQANVDYLIEQFDNHIYPIEADWWSKPPNRAGNKAALPKLVGFPQNYYKGEGDNVVVLVDNVRDDNFYDEDNANSLSYIAGFYYSVFDDYFDRTVMSIDAWDWLHRTTADPPHNPTSNPCTSAPARPYLYEGVFAHEYQHLLHHYTDPDEVNWVNEGLSDFTEVITNYADLSKHVDEKGYEGHTQCYLGWVSVMHPDWNPIPRACGPENGLTAWQDQGADEILADYGFAMYFMNFLHSQPNLDKSFFTSWQHNAGNGIAGLNSALGAAGSSSDFQSLLEDELISALIDGYLDNGATGGGSQYQNDAAEATIYFSPEANATVGAPPWGADYIGLGAGSTLSSVAFDGDDDFTFPGGTQFVVSDGYFTNPDVAGNKYANNLDISMARDVSGHDGEVVSFDHYYAMELGWDFGFVQVSTNGGNTWQSLACSGTTASHDPAARASIVANLPGFSGPSADETVTTTVGTAGAPVHVTCPALPAGTDLLAFRLMTDGAATFDGWHFKNIQLDGVALGDGTTDGWDNQTFFNPQELTFGLAFVGINGTVDGYGDVTAGESVHVIKPALDSGQAASLSASDLTALSGFDRVVAVVWGIPDAENSTLYQPYSLMVNGVERADGS